MSFISARAPGAAGGRQQQEGRSSGGLSPWRLGEYLRLGLERPERGGGVQTTRTQVCATMKRAQGEIFPGMTRLSNASSSVAEQQQPGASVKGKDPSTWTR